jgi:hypothetical protein
MDILSAQKKQSIEEVLSFLRRPCFSNAIDRIGEYSRKSRLYFAEVAPDKYLVLNHFNYKRRIDLQGFDMWIAEYGRTREIGDKPAKTQKMIKLCVALPRDLALFEPYV